ncbi:hypothetical protein EDD53_1144 [Pacificibacter maritimus]|uniref:Uncharacterized protein n=1 Tax=Pacificibacter maritimus TaxID=762213 RepID=A0A3N4V4F7_9RHOB|nr:hypothetical protein [Pacificibacter maritimus]RPE72007.1 hypothetical protein EDD53_1144 [Pacificibacter maritimus]
MTSINISKYAFQFLKDDAIAFVETEPKLVLDRIIRELLDYRTAKSSSNTEHLFGANDEISLTETKPVYVEIEGKPSLRPRLYWNYILADVINAASSKGLKIVDLDNLLQIKILQTTTQQKSIYLIESLGISFQGLDAERAYQNIRTLSIRFGININIGIKWYQKEKAQYPGQTAKISLP